MTRPLNWCERLMRKPLAERRAWLARWLSVADRLARRHQREKDCATREWAISHGMSRADVDRRLHVFHNSRSGQ